MTQRTITLPDGYNGRTEQFNAEPIAVDGDLVKLAVAGKPWLQRWARKADVDSALATQEGAQ